MTYLAVFEEKPGADGTGGNRIIMSFENKRVSHHQAPQFAGRYTLVAQSITMEEANKLCCAHPDICVVISALGEMFDPDTGRLLFNTATVGLAISKALFGIKANHEYQKKYDVTPTGILPETLKNLGFHQAGDTDKMHFIKSLRNAYPTGIIEDEKDLRDMLDGLVRITYRRGHP